jgi:Protein of unknown function (DUF3467)
VTEGHDRDDEQNDRACMTRAYANFLSVGHNMSEVLLDFGQFFSTGAAPVYHTRIVTSPLHLRSFHELIGGAIARYEQEFGPLPDDDATVRRQ